MILMILACKAPTAATETMEPQGTPLEWTDISTTVEANRTDARVPALAAAVFTSEGIDAFGIGGKRQRRGDESITWDDPFHLGSLTKSMTGTLAARMVEQGGVDWSTPVESVWPDAHVDWHGVTLEHLLKHQSGAAENPDNATFTEMYARDADDPQVNRAWLAGVILAEPPATARNAFSYSNTGLILAGAMLEELFDESWETQMQREVFEPLGMDRCGFGAPIGHAPWGHNGQTAVGPTQPNSDNPRSFGPAGTVHCPMEDYGHYIVAHLTQDETLLSAASWEEIHEPAAGDYAAGWIQFSQPWTNGPALGHDGSNTLWLARAWLAPGIDRAYVVLTNRGDANGVEAVDATMADLIGRD